MAFLLVVPRGAPKDSQSGMTGRRKVIDIFNGVLPNSRQQFADRLQFSSGAECFHGRVLSTKKKAEAPEGTPA